MKNLLLSLFERYRTLWANFSYITVLEVFHLLLPLITYPYLVRVLGTEAYGWVIIAQTLVSYFITLVNFGFRSVSARYVSHYRESQPILGRILMSILTLRSLLWLVGAVVYVGIVWCVPSFRERSLLFFTAYILTFEILLYPQFFFQGLEQMKYVCFVGLGARSLSVLLIFLFVRSPAQDYLVSLFYGIGYFVAGVVSLGIIFWQLRVPWVRFSYRTTRLLLRDAWPVFLSTAVTLIKDKVNYFVVGGAASVSWVVVYDLGVKFVNMLCKPAGIVSTVLFPRLSQRPTAQNLWRGAGLVSLVSVPFVLAVIVLVPWVCRIFIPTFTQVAPMRFFLISAMMLALTGYFYHGFMVAFGYVKHMLYCMLVTTLAYGVCLGMFYMLNILDSLWVLFTLAFVGYATEFVYNIVLAQQHAPFRWEYLRVEGLFS